MLQPFKDYEWFFLWNFLEDKYFQSISLDSLSWHTPVSKVLVETSLYFQLCISRSVFSFLSLFSSGSHLFTIILSSHFSCMLLYFFCFQLIKLLFFILYPSGCTRINFYMHMHDDDAVIIEMKFGEICDASNCSLNKFRITYNTMTWRLVIRWGLVIRWLHYHSRHNTY